MLFGNNYINYNKFGIVGLAIMVKGVFRKGRFNDRINLNIASITPLTEVKGKLLSNLTIQVPEDRLKELSLLKESMTESTENRCSLNFRIFTDDRKHYVDMRSQYKIPINKQVLNTLESMEMEFSINKNEE